MKHITEPTEPVDRALQHVGDRIWRRRKALALSCESLGLAVGCCASTISHYERGTRGMTLHTLIQIAAALGCSVNDLTKEI